MASKTSDSISYTGQVKLTLHKNGKKVTEKLIKNKGTQLMFQGIAQVLVKNIDYDYLPNYLGIGSSVEDIGANRLTREIARVLITDKDTAPHIEYQDNLPVANGYDAIFKVTIPYSTIGSSQIRELGLFGTRDSNSLLARIVIASEEDPLKVTTGMSLTVEWRVWVKDGGNI